MLEGNKDEASRCLDLAETAISTGNYDKAVKFIGKAQKLYPTTRADHLIDLLKETMAQGGGSGGTGGGGTGAASGGTQTDGPRKRRVSPSRETNTQPEYTADQLEAVKQINKCNNYYEILGVTKEATDSDVKKAYKKLALQLHPDKNQAPGASEAFKTVGNAAAVLLDPKKRKYYDTFGGEDERVNQHAGHQQAGNFYTQTFTSDFAAEELFNMFFNGGNPQVFTRRGGRFHREAHHQQHREAQGNYSSLLQMIPIIGLILLSMMSTVFISDPVYSLRPSNKFPIMRKTEQLKIPYYVKENFHNEYHGSVRRLELTVEEDVVTALRHGCHRERSYRESLIYKARLMGDRTQLEAAQRMKMPSCDDLQNLQGS